MLTFFALDIGLECIRTACIDSLDGIHTFFYISATLCREEQASRHLWCFTLEDRVPWNPGAHGSHAYSSPRYLCLSYAVLDIW